MKDWSNFVSFEPETVFRPKSDADLHAVLDDIAAGRVDAKDVRVLGSMHSCSRTCESSAVIDVSGMPSKCSLSADKRSALITANHTLHATLDDLAKEGKSLAATGGTYHQTLAGLISTATAPATPSVSLYSALQWVEYVTIDEATKSAVTHRVARGEPTFPGVVCSLGAIGALTRVQMDVIDQPFFRAVQKVVPMQSILGDLDATSRKYDFWRVNWIPKSDKALLWAATRIPEAEADPLGDYGDSAAENMLAFLFRHWDQVALGAPGPLLDPFIEAVYDVMAVFYNDLGKNTFTGPLRKMLPVDKNAPLRVAMAEWGFAPSDLQKVLLVCRTYFGAHGWPNVPTEIELSKSDPYWMSPWHWPGHEYVLKLNFMYLTDVCKTDAEKQLIVTHLRGLWAALVAANITFKAHWGKLNFLTPDYVARHYEWDEFRPLVCSRFVNPYLRERLPL